MIRSTTHNITMASFEPTQQNLSNLKDKVVVLTGGANGIGAATVKLLSENGAHVVFGDVDTAGGSAVADSLPEDVEFANTDVTSYQSILALFDKAYETYGRVDVAISNAGITERPGWFEASVDMESVRSAPSTTVLDVNLTGALYFSRIATVYLRQNAAPTDDKSLLLLSSVAGFEESPGLFVYQAAKHGVLGLMRSLRKYFPGAYGNPGIRVNCVCPWATDTVMVATFADAWKAQGLPMNSPEGIARIIVGISGDREIHGESAYVEGNRGWLIEEGLKRTHPEWLGESAASSLARGQEFLGNGYKWS